MIVSPRRAAVLSVVAVPRPTGRAAQRSPPTRSRTRSSFRELRGDPEGYHRHPRWAHRGHWLTSPFRPHASSTARPHRLPACLIPGTTDGPLPPPVEVAVVLAQQVPALQRRRGRQWQFIRPTAWRLPEINAAEEIKPDDEALDGPRSAGIRRHPRRPARASFRDRPHDQPGGSSARR